MKPFLAEQLSQLPRFHGFGFTKPPRRTFVAFDYVTEVRRVASFSPSWPTPSDWAIDDGLMRPAKEPASK